MIFHVKPEVENKHKVQEKFLVCRAVKMTTQVDL